MTTTALVARDSTARGDLRPIDIAPGVVAPIDQWRILDTFSGGYSDAPTRVDALATISAGYRGPERNGRPGLPQRSTDGTIYLHDPDGRAPGLAEALAQGEQKRLTVAFPLDDPRQFIHQSFRRYSASRLEAYGDANSLTEIVLRRTGQTDKDGKPILEADHMQYAAGTAQYADLVRTCKNYYDIYFCLAEWTANGPEVVQPDGFGLYRLRTTSRHTIRNIEAALRYVAQFTRGRLAGIPFELRIEDRKSVV